MYCPRCNQQQISEEIKYCSRCGLPLEVVAEVLAHDGFLPPSDNSPKKKKLITRNLGLKLALMWFVIFTILLPLLAGATNAPGNIMTGLVTFGFTGAVFIGLLSWLFLSNDYNSFSKRETDSPKNLGAEQTPTALPPLTSQTVSDYAPPFTGSWKTPTTGELAPHSVTDGTTKLFQKEE